MSTPGSMTETNTLEKGIQPTEEISTKKTTREPPEGGSRAWLTVAGSAAALFVTFGWVNCIGLFQAQYEAHELRQYSSSEISWITSMECKSSLRLEYYSC